MKEISVNELKSLFDSNSDFQLIDVREPHERDIATIGGENIPLGTITQNADKFDRNKQVIIYCRSGKRSGDAALTLQRDFGFQNLYNLKGGILAYSDEIDPSLTKY
ncbi:MAG: rhodanese-like domain-containing protein [Ignavibacteria bacterium]|nr:rhodanese-like domain-containing protein [Ignavibacteria bacterium]MBL7991663.1 rhodanese-like domain-containing protein [Candidatus Kapabacteria bacterium]